MANEFRIKNGFVIGTNDDGTGNPLYENPINKISTDSSLTGDSDTTLVTQNAIKTYVTTTTGNKEDSLGTPTEDGQVLASDISGSRSWVNKLSEVFQGANVTIDKTDPLNPIISAIGGTTAGILDRVYFTGDEITLSAGTYYLTSRNDKGSVDQVVQTVSVDSTNPKLFFAQDLVGPIPQQDTTIRKGNYTGIIVGMTNSNTDEQKYTIEVYLCDADGNPIDAGTGLPNGDLGVPPMVVADTGVIDMQRNNESELSFAAPLNTDITLTTNNRVRYHIAGESVDRDGGGIGDQTLSLFYGYNFNSYIDVPVTATTDSVVNVSNITGSTASDALNWLNTNKISTSVTDVTDLSLHSATELNDITNTGSGEIITSTERTKLTGIEDGAQVNVQSDWNVSDTNSDAYILNKPNVITSVKTIDGDDITGTGDKLVLTNTGDLIDDFDTATKAGVYRGNSSALNIPPTFTGWSSLFVYNTGTNSDYIVQTAIDGDGRGIASRRYNSGAGGWSEWREYEKVPDTFIQNNIPMFNDKGQLEDAGIKFDDTIETTTNIWSANKILTETDAKVEWKGEWANVEYQKNDMVRDGDWTMIANTTTTDRPAPQDIGDPYNPYNGTLTETDVTAKQVIFGNRYTATKDLYITKYRVYTKAGQKYRVYRVLDPLGSKVMDEVTLFEAKIDGWEEFNVDQKIITNGTVYDFLVVTNEADPTITTNTANYNYNTPAQAGAPANGEIRHSNFATDILNVSKTDNDGTDQSAMLGALSIGDKIKGPGIEWTIQGITDQVSYIDFAVDPQTQGNNDGVFAFEFVSVTTAPISYSHDDGYWSGNANADGLLAIDSEYENITPDDNAYGIDITIQEISKSPDWDIVAITSAIEQGPTENGIPDAPSDGNLYGRKDATWSIVPEYDLSVKADKVSGATNGHIAGLDANGNLTDAGIYFDDTAETTSNIWSASQIKSAIGSSGGGDVSGPSSSTDSHIAIFDGTTGKVIKDGGSAISDLATATDLSTHTGDTNNPHSVTAAQVGNTTAQWNANALQSIMLDDNVSTPTAGDLLGFTSNGKWESVTYSPSITLSKAITVPAPQNGDDFTMWITDTSITITKIVGKVSEGSLTVDINGNSGTIDSTSSPYDIISISSANVAADTAIVYSGSNVSGVTGYVNVTVYYTID